MDRLNSMLKSNGTVVAGRMVALRRATAFDKKAEVPSAAVLWRDEEKARLDLIPRLRAAIPRFSA